MRDRPSRPGHPRGRPRPASPGRASRPAARRSGGAGSGAATRTSAPRPPGRLTGRAVVLGVVLLVLALSYILPLRIYLGQQAEISQLRESQAGQRADIAELEAEAARWADDEYVRIQARRRHFFVEPGEVPIIVVWDDPAGTDGEPDPDQGAERSRAWWEALWSSVQAADRGGQPAAGDPATGEETDEDPASGEDADPDEDGAEPEAGG